MENAKQWLDANWKKLVAAAIAALVFYLSAAPFSDLPEVKAVSVFLKALLAIIGVGI